MFGAAKRELRPGAIASAAVIKLPSDLKPSLPCSVELMCAVDADTTNTRKPLVTLQPDGLANEMASVLKSPSQYCSVFLPLELGTFAATSAPRQLNFNSSNSWMKSDGYGMRIDPCVRESTFWLSR